MNKEQRQVLAELRHQGYAVIIWSPEELGDASVNQVQDRSIELGHRVIEDLQCPPTCPTCGNVCICTI